VAVHAHPARGAALVPVLAFRRPQHAGLLEAVARLPEREGGLALDPGRSYLVHQRRLARRAPYVPLLRYHPAMPRPRDEHQALEHERERALAADRGRGKGELKNRNGP
jgi:hypothetical protein